MSRFIDPSSIVAQAEIAPGQIVADFGSGSGFYAIPSAKIVGSSGTVYAVDVQDPKLDATQSLARQSGLKNITTVKADLDKPLLDIAEASCDLVIIASIIHEIESKQSLLKNAYRLMKTGGKLLAVEWKKELTPFGPPVESRVSLSELEALLQPLGLRKHRELSTDGYHYAVLFIK